MNRRHFLGVLVLMVASGVLVLADQPRMVAARTNLNQAKAQLQAALRNKGGHRANAIAYINSAIAEINAGMRFDRRNNHAQVNKAFTFATEPDQPHMERALENLRQARSNLEAASTDKGGHRANAIGFVNKAIDEVKKGIAAGE